MTGKTYSEPREHTMIHLTGHGRLVLTLPTAFIVIGLVALVVRGRPLQTWRRRFRSWRLGVERG